MVADCSQWTETISAPAFTKSSTRCSGSTIICMTSFLSASQSCCGYQVTVEWLVSDRSESIDHQWPNGDVGNEAPVHDVHVHPITPSVVNGFDLKTGQKDYVIHEGMGLASEPRLAKSAERIEGATMISLLELLSTRLVASTTSLPRVARRLRTVGAEKCRLATKADMRSITNTKD